MAFENIKDRLRGYSDQDCEEGWRLVQELAKEEILEELGMDSRSLRRFEAFPPAPDVKSFFETYLDTMNPSRHELNLSLFADSKYLTYEHRIMGAAVGEEDELTAELASFMSAYQEQVPGKKAAALDLWDSRNDLRKKILAAIAEYSRKDTEEAREEWQELQTRLHSQAGKAWSELDKKRTDGMHALEERYQPLLNQSDSQREELTKRLKSSEHATERRFDADGKSSFLPETTLDDMDDLIEEDQQMVMQEYLDDRNSLQQELNELWKERVRSIISSMVEENEKNTVPIHAPRDYAPETNKWISLMNMYDSMFKSIVEEISAMRYQLENKIEVVEAAQRDPERILQAPGLETPTPPTALTELEECLAAVPVIDKEYFAWKNFPGGRDKNNHLRQEYHIASQVLEARRSDAHRLMANYQEVLARLIDKQKSLQEDWRDRIEDLVHQQSPGKTRNTMEHHIASVCQEEQNQLRNMCGSMKGSTQALKDSKATLVDLTSRMDEEVPDQEDQDPDIT